MAFNKKPPDGFSILDELKRSPDDIPPSEDREGFTAPLGSVGFTMSDHVACFDALRHRQIMDGTGELPDACKRGHVPHPNRARVH